MSKFSDRDIEVDSYTSEHIWKHRNDSAPTYSYEAAKFTDNQLLETHEKISARIFLRKINKMQITGSYTWLDAIESELDFRTTP